MERPQCRVENRDNKWLEQVRNAFGRPKQNGSGELYSPPPCPVLDRVAISNHHYRRSNVFVGKLQV